MPAQSSSFHESVVATVIELLRKGNAHVPLDAALEGVSFSLLGKKAVGLPYSIWQLAEHIRIAQWDLLEFSRDPKHVSPDWPEGYWPKEVSPASEKDWKNCIAKIVAEREAFIELVDNAGEKLYEVFKHGTGQTLLKEALVLADHNSYHTGQVVLIRKMLNNWG